MLLFFSFVLFFFWFFFQASKNSQVEKNLVSLLLKGFVGVVVVFSLCDLVVSFK